MTGLRSPKFRAAALLFAVSMGATVLGAQTAHAQDSPDALRPIAEGVIDASGSVSGVGDAVSAGSSFGPELPQVDKVDPTKFAGTWYQIAVLPQPTSLQCVDNTKAEYGVIDESTLSVRNSCDDIFGGNSAVVGKAFVKDAKTNASLRVAFDGIPGQDPDGPVNYRVTYLAEDYSLAIVGDPARRSGFVLSRTPGISDADWAKVAEILTDRGYQPCTFITSPQAEGRRDFTPVCAIGSESVS